MNCRSLLCLAFVALLLTSCVGGGGERAAMLDRADSLSYVRPDSALSLLDSLRPEKDKWPESQRMLYELFHARAQNKAYVDFTSDSVMLEVVRYYDSNGTSNQRMESHYLLGCVYRDLGMAPQALEFYHEAINCADTLSNDCNLQCLMSIYSQMGELFHYQNLPSDEEEAYCNYIRYARFIGDTARYIRGLVMMGKSSFLQGDTMKVLQLFDEARRCYVAVGDTKEANSLYGPLIYHQLLHGQLKEARRLMDSVENSSNVYDSNGSLSVGRESYLYLKGLYQLKTRNTEEAEKEFRNLLRYRYACDAYRGLLFVFHEKGNSDSVAKYAQLYENAVDSNSNNYRTEAVHRISSLYRYQRYLLKAEKEKQKAERTRLLSILFLIPCVVVLLLLYLSNRRYRRKKLAEISQLSFDLDKVKSKYEKTCTELELLQMDHRQLKINKTEEIEELKSMIDTLQERWHSVHPDDKEAAILNSNTVKSFHEKAKGKKNVPLPTDNEWEHLINLFKQCLPSAYAVIKSSESPLSPLEYQTCILLLLKFSNGEIAVLLNVSPQRVTNIKKRANQKMFSVSDALSLEKNLRRVVRSMF